VKAYDIVEVNENTLEELIRNYASKIEDGLKFVDRQVKTDRDRRLDVLLVDSGGALVVMELKVVEDDGMLLQGIDYYDYITRHLESLVRAYDKFRIHPEQSPRLMLIAPSFSMSLLDRCKWLSIPTSIYTFQCIKLEGESDIIPVFMEVSAPEIPKAPINRKNIGEILEYITDIDIRKTASNLLSEVKNWDKDNISLDPIQDWVSLKFKGKTFAYLGPRRAFFGLQILDEDGNWPWVTVHIEHREKELDEVRKLLKEGIDRLKLHK
jgi:hypothetical protein